MIVAEKRVEGLFEGMEEGRGEGDNGEGNGKDGESRKTEKSGIGEKRKGKGSVSAVGKVVFRRLERRRKGCAAEILGGGGLVERGKGAPMVPFERYAYSLFG